MTLSTAEVWAVVHAERQRLCDDLAALPAAGWETPSLCPGWTVHDVLAHLVDTARTGTRAFVVGMVRARGDFDHANADGIRRSRHDDPARTLADLRASRDLTRTPPAHRATRLVEAVVHGEDIRRPLGITGSYPDAALHDALAYQLRTTVSFGGGRERARGRRLVDTGTGVSWGDGAEVSGRAVDLLLAVSGRAVAPGLLTGAGLVAG